jgi:hypothetical protein
MGHKLSHWILTTALWGGKLRFQKGGKKKKNSQGRKDQDSSSGLSKSEAHALYPGVRVAQGEVIFSGPPGPPAVTQCKGAM